MGWPTASAVGHQLWPSKGDMDPVRMLSAVKRFVADDGAQDLVEYAYLVAFMGLLGLVIWANIVTLMGDHYSNANTNVENLWASPDP